MRDAGFDAGFVSVPLGSWCATYALAQCQRGVRCGLLDQGLLDECIAQRLIGCDQVALSRGGAEGRLDYDPAAGARCLDAYGAGSCETTPPGCLTVFVGKAAPDAGCLIAPDCDSQRGYCDLYDFTCPHHCRAWAEHGEACDFFQECRFDGGVCDTGDAGVRACLPVRAEGDSCVNYDSCGKSMYCSSGQCVKQVAQLAEPCNKVNGFPYCDDAFFCRAAANDAGSTCQRKAGIGGGCFGYGSCLPSLRCSSSIGGGTCQPRAGVGERCSGYAECMDSLYCPPLTSRCSALPGDGGDCSPTNGSSYACAQGFACHIDFAGDVYQCLPLLRLGEACSSADWCLSNTCNYGPLVDGGFGNRCSQTCAQKADGGL